LRKALIFCLLALALAFAQPKHRIAVLPSIGEPGTLDDRGLNLLTDKVREIASKTLPPSSFMLLRQEAVISAIGGEEEFFRECKEGTCVGELAKKANADYGARCDVLKLGEDLVLKFELYSVKDEAILETFTDYKVKDFHGMLAVLEEKLPNAFGKMLRMSGKGGPVILGGIGDVETVAGGILASGERRYIVNLNTEPQGANLSFNGLPVASCGKTPCDVELPEGSIRIIAALEQYETADTTISVKQNNQGVNIQLKANFGVLEVKSAYSGNTGSDKNWDLTINGKAAAWKSRLSPGNYEVKLSHECYEDISFKVGINKGGHEAFDMAKYLNLKQGVLDLSAEMDEKPVSESVFVDGKEVGETPFIGPVPICSEIMVGKEKVDVQLKNRETVRHTHKIDAPPPSKTQVFEKSVEKSVERSTIVFAFGFMLNGYLGDEKLFSDENDKKDSDKSSAGSSVGLVTGLAFTNWLALYSEFYFTHRVFNNEDCSVDCTRIEELVFDIPLLIKLSPGSMDGFYVDAGILFGIPLSTKIETSVPPPYLERGRDFGYLFGIGITKRYEVDMGIRLIVNTSNFAKDTKGSFWSLGFHIRGGWL
jgi:hypothetical protein